MDQYYQFIGCTLCPLTTQHTSKCVKPQPPLPSIRHHCPSTSGIWKEGQTIIFLLTKNNSRSVTLYFVRFFDVFDATHFSEIIYQNGKRNQEGKGQGHGQACRRPRQVPGAGYCCYRGWYVKSHNHMEHTRIIHTYTKQSQKSPPQKNNIQQHCR